MGDDGLTVQTNKPLSQPTTNTDPDRGLNFKKSEKNSPHIQCICIALQNLTLQTLTPL